MKDVGLRKLSSVYIPTSYQWRSNVIFLKMLLLRQVIEMETLIYDKWNFNNPGSYYWWREVNQGKRNMFPPHKKFFT